MRVIIVDEYETVIRKIHSYSIAIHGFFILGLDEDDEDVFECPEQRPSVGYRTTPYRKWG